MYMYYLLKNHDFQVGNTLTLKTNFGGANLVAWSKSLCPDPQKTYNFNVKSEEKNVTNLYMFHSNLSIQILGKFFGGQIHKMYVKFSSFFLNSLNL